MKNGVINPFRKRHVLYFQGCRGTCLNAYSASTTTCDGHMIDMEKVDVSVLSIPDKFDTNSASPEE